MKYHLPTERQNIDNLNKLQSETINILRFPLAIAVVFIHVEHNTTGIMKTVFSIFSIHGLYNIICILISEIIAQIAVPMFFMISGLLFFINLERWSWDVYKAKIKRRIPTLIIPYLLWNILPFLFVLFGKYAEGETIEEIATFIQETNWHILYNCSIFHVAPANILGCQPYMTGPFNMPLWFLRDLIVMTLLTPVIYYILRRFRVWSIAVLAFAYCSNIWPQISGFSITAFFYFSLGSYFSINRINILNILRKMRSLLLSASLILICADMYLYDYKIIVEQYVYPILIFVTMFAAFYIAYATVRRYSIKINKTLTSSCFFIYALHMAPVSVFRPMNISSNILQRIIPGHDAVKDIICYITTPFLTIFICICVFLIIRFMSPKAAYVLSGGR